jgi:hypothetical protein
VENFRFDVADIRVDVYHKLENLSRMLEEDMQHNSRMLEYQYSTGLRRFQAFYPRKSKHIIDEIDRVLAQHYGFTDEELDFIINYDIKYRMGLVDGTGDSDEEE